MTSTSHPPTSTTPPFGVEVSTNGAHHPVTLPELPASVRDRRGSRLRTWLRRLGVLAAVAALAAGVVLAADRRGNTALALRTATVTSADISSTYAAVVTLEPVDQASVGFPVAGTVATVEVAPGDTVAVGDVLATLDSADLEQARRAAEADLADAQLVLATALAGDDPSALLGGTGAAAFTSTGLSTSGVDLTGEVVFGYASALVDQARYVLAAVGDADVAAAQQAVLAAQTAVTEATNTAAAALDSAVAVCAAVQTDITPYVDPNDPTAAITYPTDTIVACRSALDAVVAAQQQVTARQGELASAAAALDALLGQWADELATAATSTTVAPEPDTTTTTPSATPTPEPTATPDDTTVTTTTPAEPAPATTPAEPAAPATTEPTDAPVEAGGRGSAGGGGSAPSGGGGGSGGTSATAYEPTAEELIGYQIAVDAAGYEVAAAEQAIAQAAIVSPIAGTVVSAAMTVGDSVTAATEAVVVQGSGGIEATTTVSLDDIDRIAVGQPVTVTPDGSAAAVIGEVVAIGLTPDSAAATASYRVTIGLDGESDALRSGNLGSAEIVISSTSAATAVPTSAVKLDGDRATVIVVNADGTTATQAVTVGVVGAAWTEVASGLTAGQTIVLADPSAALPSAGATAAGSDATAVFPGSGGIPTGGFGRP